MRQSLLRKGKSLKACSSRRKDGEDLQSVLWPHQVSTGDCNNALALMKPAVGMIGETTLSKASSFAIKRRRRAVLDLSPSRLSSLERTES